MKSWALIIFIVFVEGMRASPRIFKVIKTSSEINTGWRISTHQDVVDLPSEVRRALKQTIVRSVELDNGQLSVDYEGHFTIRNNKFYKGWKLMVHSRSGVFRLRWYTDEDWRVATKDDVTGHVANVVRALIGSTAMSSALKLHTFRLQNGYLKITEVLRCWICFERSFGVK